MYDLINDLINKRITDVEITYIIGGEETNELIHLLSVDKDWLFYGVYENNYYYEEILDLKYIKDIRY